MSDPYTRVTDARHLAAKGLPVTMSTAAYAQIEAAGYRITSKRHSHHGVFDIIVLHDPVFDDTEVKARHARGEFGPRR